MSYINLPPGLINFKYTQGGEYILQQNSKDYKGYYFEFKNEIYAGKEFNLNVANKLIKTADVISNPLDIYEIISGAKIPRSQEIPSIPFNPTEEEYTRGNMMRYFIKKINKNNTIIETNESTFEKIQTNPLYQTLAVNYSFGIDDEGLDKLDKQMFGLKDFILTNDIRTSVDESDPTTVFF